MIFDTTNATINAARDLPNIDENKELKTFAITMLAQKIYTLARLNKAGANPQPLGLGNYDWSQAIQAAALQLGELLGEHLHSYKKIESEAWKIIAEAEEAGPDSFKFCPTIRDNNSLYALVNPEKENPIFEDWAEFSEEDLSMAFVSPQLESYLNSRLPHIGPGKVYDDAQIILQLTKNKDGEPLLKNVFLFANPRGWQKHGRLSHVKTQKPYKYEDLIKADAAKNKKQNHG